MKRFLTFAIVLGFSHLAFCDSTLPAWLTEEAVNGKFECGGDTSFIIDTHTEQMTHNQNGASTTSTYILKVEQDHVAFAFPNTWINFWIDGRVETLFNYQCEKVL